MSPVSQKYCVDYYLSLSQTPLEELKVKEKRNFIRYDY